MICNCGGRMWRTSAAENGADLSWQQCGACGRCDRYRLVVGKQPIATGKAARLAFQDGRLIQSIRQRSGRCVPATGVQK